MFIIWRYQEEIQCSFRRPHVIYKHWNTLKLISIYIPWFHFERKPYKLFQTCSRLRLSFYTLYYSRWIITVWYIQLCIRNEACYIYIFYLLAYIYLYVYVSMLNLTIHIWRCFSLFIILELWANGFFSWIKLRLLLPHERSWGRTVGLYGNRWRVAETLLF